MELALLSIPAVRPLILAVGNNPSSTLPDGTVIGPQLIGFVCTFAVVVATILLIVNMTRRIRRMRVRGEAEEAQRAREEDVTGSGSGQA